MLHFFPAFTYRFDLKMSELKRLPVSKIRISPDLYKQIGASSISTDKPLTLE